MRGLVVVVLVACFLSGCVKVNLLPEDAVKNSFKAGKNLYDEAKLKRQGGKKRELSRQVMLEEYANRTDAEDECLQNLKSKIFSESTDKAPVIVSEKIIVVDGVANNTIECQVVGYVWSA